MLAFLKDIRTKEIVKLLHYSSLTISLKETPATMRGNRDKSAVGF